MLLSDRHRVFPWKPQVGRTGVIRQNLSAADQSSCALVLSCPGGFSSACRIQRVFFFLKGLRTRRLRPLRTRACDQVSLRRGVMWEPFPQER